MTDNIISVNEKSGELRFNSRGFSHLGYSPPATLTFDAWSNDAAFVRSLDRANKWIAGDYFAAGERFGEDAFQVLGDEHAWGFGPEKMKKLTWVARNVRPPQRRNDLSWSHHMLVAPLTPEEQDDWLLLAVTKEYTVEQLKAVMVASGAIVLRQKTTPVQEVIPVPYLDMKPAVEATPEETVNATPLDALQAPDYPTTILEMSDLGGGNGSSNGNGAGYSNNNGFERAPQWDADNYDYEDDDEVKFKIGKGAAKAARIIMNLAGAAFCASLVQELVLLATDEVYDAVSA
jgi:hypothetical protein